MGPSLDVRYSRGNATPPRKVWAAIIHEPARLTRGKPDKTPSRRSGYVPLMEPASVHTRFLRAVDYIEDHLSEPIALADVAKQAGFSLHYFSRLFRVLTGETFG